jgi:hypothetical protein
MAVTYCLAVAVTIAVIWLWVNGVAHGEPLPVIRIELKEYAFSPARVSIPVGKPVVFRVINRGRTTHMVTSPYLASSISKSKGQKWKSTPRRESST